MNGDERLKDSPFPPPRSKLAAKADDVVIDAEAVCLGEAVSMPWMTGPWTGL